MRRLSAVHVLSVPSGLHDLIFFAEVWVTQPTALDSKVISGPSAVVLSKIPGYAETLKNGFVLLAKKTEPFLNGTPFKIPISVLNSFIDLASVRCPMYPFRRWPLI
jgi:hypothetical protein